MYACIPHKLLKKVSEDRNSEWKKALQNAARKYFKEPNSIEICVSENSRIQLFIMEKPKYAGSEDSIRSDLTDQVHSLYPDAEVDIKINYAALFPEFHPQEYKPEKQEDRAEHKREEAKFQSGKGEFDYEKLSENYQAEQPRYSFGQVILPERTRMEIEEAVGIIQVEQKVFDEWGLRRIIPTATSALSFYGPPGTGKSMAAEAVAQKMGKKILSATYADIESKYHGEGPKMVKAIFRAAEKQDAVLFLDESDSLLSKRLTNVSDGSAQAINSMRSQLLISLEKFKGVVIFATNLVVNYDRAFLSRLINIEFSMPDVNARMEIWNEHIRGAGIQIPLAPDVKVMELAENYEFCGRDIKNAVRNACVSAALQGYNYVTQEIFLKACEKTKLESEKAIMAGDHTNMKKTELSDQAKDSLKKAIQKQIDIGDPQ